MITPEKEAEIIARYLIGAKLSRANQNLFDQAIKTHNIKMNQKDQRIWNLVLNHPALLPYIDAGFALIQPTNSIRKKIYIMFAVLETEPSYSEFFLYNKKRIPWVINAGWLGLRALFRAIVGFFILKSLILYEKIS
ncbi:MAG: hypothetical protein AAB474_00545 [Patescibacteria group bacterium]